MNKTFARFLLHQVSVLLVLVNVGLAGALEPSERTAILRELWSHPSLETACILSAERAPDGNRVDLVVLVDAAREADQVAEITRLVSGCLDLEARVRQVQRLPVEQLLEELRQQVKSSESLRGCSLGGGFFDYRVSKGQAVDLVLYGEFVTREQLSTLGGLCDALLQQDPAWSQFQDSPPQVLFLPAPDGAFAPTETEAFTFEKLRQSVVDERPLHGAWPDLRPAYDRRGVPVRHYATVWLDAAQASDQLSRMQELFGENVEGEVRILRELKFPLSDLIGQLRSDLSAEFGKKSCWVVGAYYQKTSPQNVVDLVLYGQAFTSGEEKRVVDRCSELIKEDPRWKLTEEYRLVPVDRKLLPADPAALTAIQARMNQACQGIRRELSDDPRLHGTWVRIASCLDHRGSVDHYDVELWLDVDRAEQQRPAVEKLLDRSLGKHEIVEEIRLPLSQLVADLQRGIEREYGPGCHVAGAYYHQQQPDPAAKAAPADNAPVEIVLYGRVWNEGMKRWVEDEAKRLKDLDPAWQTPAGALAVVDRGLRQHTLSADSREVRGRLRAELSLNPDLHGAWIDLAECYDHRGELDHYEVCLWLDPTRPRIIEEAAAAERSATEETDLREKAPDRAQSPAVGGNSSTSTPPAVEDRAEPPASVAAVERSPAPGATVVLTEVPQEAPSVDQREEVLKLLDRWLGSDRYVVLHEAEAPVAELVSEARSAIEAELGPGCYLMGAYFDQPEEAENVVELVIYGRLFEEWQKQRVKDHVDAVMRREPAWQQLPILGPRSDTEPPRPGAAWATARVTAVDRRLISPETSPELKLALQQIRQAIEDDPLLHGAWVDVADCMDHNAQLHHYQVYLWLDEGHLSAATGGASSPTVASQADLQRAEIIKLLDRALGKGRYAIAAEARLPLSRLVSDLRASVARDFGKGCFVRGGYYRAASEDAAAKPADASSSVELVLYGRVFEDWQKQRIVDWAREMLRADPGFNRLPGPRDTKLVVVDRKLHLDEPSERMQALRTQIRQTIADDPRLRGVWLDLAECLDHKERLDHYEVYLWLNAAFTPGPPRAPTPEDDPTPEEQSETRRWVWTDRCGCPHFVEYQVALPGQQPAREPHVNVPALPPVRPDEQRTLVGQILDQCLGAGRHVVVDEAALPFSDLIARLQGRIQDLYGPGCFLAGGQYAQVPDPQQPAVELVLLGQVFHDEQRLRIIDECNRLMAASPAWGNLPGPRGNRLVVVDRQLKGALLSEPSRQKLADVRQVLFNDPQLHGAWVDLAECKDRRGDPSYYDVCLWLDSDKRESQRNEILDVLDRQLGEGKYGIVKEAALPLAALVANLTQRIEAAYGPACGVSGAYYDQQPDAPNGPVEIVLYGRARDDEMRQFIVNQCSRLKDGDPSWSQVPSLRGDPVIVVDRRLPVYQHSAEARRRLEQICRSTFGQPGLRGSWIDLTERFDHLDRLTQYDVCVRRDEQNGAEQREKLVEVLDRVLGGRYQILSEDHLPVSDLVTRVNLSMDATRNMDGCLVQAIHFALPSRPDANTLHRTLQVFGRVAEAQQQGKVGRLVESGLQRDLSWLLHLQELDMTLEGVEVVRPDPIRGMRVFNAGVEDFWEGRYREASQAFQLAVTDSPLSFEYRYWRIVAEMEQGNHATAFDAMRAIAARLPSQREHQRTYPSLRRIQGPTRMALLDLENRARMEFHLAYRR